MKFIPSLFLISLSTLFFSSCYYDNRQDMLGTAGVCDTSNVQFAAIVNPIITQNCNGCHGGVSPSGGISLEGHTNVKNQITAILNSINSGSMPKGSPKLDDCTILKIQTWANNGSLNN